MPATTRPLFRALGALLSAALLFVSGITPLRAQDGRDQPLSREAIRTQDLQSKMIRVLGDARQEGAKNPAAAVDILHDFRIEVAGARYLSDSNRKVFLRQLDGEIAR